METRILVCRTHLLFGKLTQYGKQGTRMHGQNC